MMPVDHFDVYLAAQRRRTRALIESYPVGSLARMNLEAIEVETDWGFAEFARNPVVFQAEVLLGHPWLWPDPNPFPRLRLFRWRK